MVKLTEGVFMFGRHLVHKRAANARRGEPFRREQVRVAADEIPVAATSTGAETHCS